MTSLQITLISIFAISCVLVIYHHVGYPLLLKYFMKQGQSDSDSSTSTLSKAGHYPSVTIVIPAFNEARWIADKLRNCAMLDYPRNKLNVQLHCDGCTDDTAKIARETIQEAICADTLFEVIEHSENRGKVQTINAAMNNASSELTVFTDVSALISMDALKIASTHFENKKVGVVNGQYSLLEAATEGEDAYWQYQSKIKQAEASLATTIGSHGAFYIFRTQLFQPLEANTINDDFILPMKIVEQGYLSDYDDKVIATELEPTPIKADFARRLRISAGNMQQVIILISLFSPRFKTIAFAFASGKGLRLFTPYLLIAAFISSFLLKDIWLFEIALYGQVALYSLAILTTSLGTHITFKPVQLFNYLIIGHTANLIGGLKYLLTRHA